jgi:hypothetical protein
MKCTAVKERRQEFRHPCSLEVVCRPVMGDRTILVTAQGQNISENGIRLTVSQPVDPGILMDTQIQDSAEHISLSRLLRVIYTQAEPDGRWTVGGEFYHELSYEELESLGV